MKRSGSGNFNRKRIAGVIGAFVAAFAICRLAWIGMEYYRGPKVYQKLWQAAVTDAGRDRISGEKDDARGKTDEKTKERKTAGNGTGTGGAQIGTGAGEEFDYRSVEIDFTYLKGINEDIIGWLLFDGYVISYPVLQGTDNREYLYTLADRTANDAGSIFMDALCSPDFEDPHTILYGHNRKDGTMFGTLKWYGRDPGYYGENRFFTIYTPQGCFRYEIFAWYEAGQEDMVYQVGFAADEVFAKFAAQLRQRGSTDTGIAVGREDNIVTLSTCSLAGRRFVVHGKRIGGERR